MSLRPRCDQLRAAVDWVLDTTSPDALGPVERVTLTRPPNRTQWFGTILPDLDYEIRGGTWENPLWAWTLHPWYAALGLTEEECLDAFGTAGEPVQGSEATQDRVVGGLEGEQ